MKNESKMKAAKVYKLENDIRKFLKKIDMSTMDLAIMQSFLFFMITKEHFITPKDIERILRKNIIPFDDEIIDDIVGISSEMICLIRESFFIDFDNHQIETCQNNKNGINDNKDLSKP